jgi:CDP-glucose 4,6-dehydratase
MEKMVKDKILKKFFKNKIILITGNTGFVGSWLTYYLTNYKCKLYGISKNYSNKKNLFNLFNLKNKIQHYTINLMDEKKTKNILNLKFDFIIHLAAEPLVIDGIKNPKKIIENNFLSTLRLINNLKINNKTIFLNFSTDKVYENDDKKEKYFTEKDRLFGQDPYSFSKTCGDLMLKMWSTNSKANKYRYLNIRSGNIIGGGDWNKARIITDIINFIFKKKKLFIRNPLSVRPWLHVIEICIIITQLLFSFNNSKKKFETFNISPNKTDERNVLWIIKNSLKFFNFKKKNIIIHKNSFKEKKYLRLKNYKIKVTDFILIS